MGSPPRPPHPFPAGRCQPAQPGTGALLGGGGASFPTRHIPNLRAAEFSGNGDELETRRRRTRDSRSESCRLRGSQALLLPLPSSWGPPQGTNPLIPPRPPLRRLFQPGCSSRPCALPATWCLPSASLRERRGRLCLSKDSRFSTSSQSAAAAALSSKEKVFPMPLSSWNQQHRE